MSKRKKTVKNGLPFLTARQSGSRMINSIIFFSMRTQRPLKPEAAEQAKLVSWLEFNHYKFSAIPNSTYTTSWNQKRINKVTWVRAGVPDIMIILKRWALLFIELKKVKWKRGGMNGSTVSEFQASWIEELSKIDNVDACVCHWFEDAKNMIEILEKR